MDFSKGESYIGKDPSSRSMKKSTKSFSLVLLLIVLAVPLVWLHLEKFEEIRTLQYDNDYLTASLATCEEEASKTETPTLFYELNGLEVTVTEKTVNFSDLFTEESLTKQAVGDCGKTIDEGYFASLTEAFQNRTGTQYSFTANGFESEVYTVTIFPNATHYPGVETFQNDFEICSVGGTTYPSRMNEEALLFTSGCGAGYGEEIPALTCADIQEKLTIEFN